MALLEKKRAASPIPNTTTIEISATVTDLIANIFKALILEMAKPEPFYRL
jgi:hypothetical protein